jgi:hypothetical protein
MRSGEKRERPTELLVTGAVVHESPGRTRRGDLRVADGVIVGPGAGSDAAEVVEATGCSAVPLLVDTVFEPRFAAASPPAPGAFDLRAGNPGTFAVIRGTVAETAIRSMLVVRPQDLVAVVVHGRLVARDGKPLRAAASDDLRPGDPRLGAWRDDARDMTQHLGPDGRYSETRNGRPDAYRGRFWLDRDRITYLDDTGFWAFGQYHDGVLHHAGFVLRRLPER